MSDLNAPDLARCPICGADVIGDHEMHRIDCKAMTSESRRYAEWRAVRATIPLVEALEDAEKDLVACEWNINAASSQGDAGWDGVPERLRGTLSSIRCVIAHHRKTTQ